MICDKCKQESDIVVPLLSFYENGKPMFRRYCAKCEKEKWMKMKEYFTEETHESDKGE